MQKDYLSLNSAQKLAIYEYYIREILEISKEIKKIDISILY